MQRHDIADGPATQDRADNRIPRLAPSSAPAKGEIVRARPHKVMGNVEGRQAAITPPIVSIDPKVPGRVDAGGSEKSQTIRYCFAERV